MPSIEDAQEHLPPAKQEKPSWTVASIQTSARPAEASVIKGRWVFKIKTTAEGVPQRFRARWVAKGFKQRQGIDYDETYASVVKPGRVQIPLLIAAYLDWEVKQYDIKTADHCIRYLLEHIRVPEIKIQHHRTVKISIQLSRLSPITDSSSDRVYSNLRELNPAAVEGRRKRARVHRGALLTPGPSTRIARWSAGVSRCVLRSMSSPTTSYGPLSGSVAAAKRPSLFSTARRSELTA